MRILLSVAAAYLLVIPSPVSQAEDPPPWRKVLTGEDANKVAGLEKGIEEFLDGGKLAEALAAAKEVETIRTGVQGKDHWEAVNARWQATTLTQITAQSPREQAEYQSARTAQKEAADLGEKAHYVEALQLSKKALALWKKLLGDEHPQTAMGYKSLAWGLQNQGKYAEAQPLFERALALKKKLLGEENPDTVTGYSNLAANLEAQGKYAEAQPLCERSLALWKKLLGEEHPDTAMSYNNLALNLQYQGKYVEAQALLERSLALWKKSIGEEHPETATIYNNLASNLQDQGKYAEAQLLFEKALAVRKKFLGEENPHTATAYNNLASNLDTQEKHAEAQPLLEKALSVCKKILGEEHPDTAMSYSNLASNLQAQGKYAEAQPLFEKALALWKNLLGEKHPGTATIGISLAFNLNAQGRYAEAQLLFENALALRRELLGEEHPETATSYKSLAVNLAEQGKYAEAQPLFENALALTRKLLGEEHPETATGYNNVASNLDSQGKYAEAQPLVEKALGLTRQLLGEDHAYTAKGYNNLASNLDSRGRHVEAQPLHEKALAIKRKLLGEEHPDTATSYNNLALNLREQGKYAEAQPLYERALALRKKLLGEEHPHTAMSYNNLASNLDAQGKYVEAQPLFEKALVLSEILGEGHLSRTLVRNNLSWNLDAQGKHKEALDQWLLAARSFEVARLRVSASGLGRAECSAEQNPLPALASAFLHEGRALEAWTYFERGLARGLLDDLSAREARKLTPEDLEREQRIVGGIDEIDARLFGRGEVATKARPADLEPLRQKRLELQAELSAFGKHLTDTYGVAEGKSYEIDRIQAALSEDAALVGWLDVKGQGKAVDLTGGHWAVVVRSRGEPHWVKLPGSGEGGRWTEDDKALGGRLAAELSDRKRLPRPVGSQLIEKLSRQRFEALENVLNVGGSHPVHSLIVLPSPALRDVPVALLADRYRVSYAPSGSVLAWLREKKRVAPNAEAASLLAIGDPAFRPPEEKQPKDDTVPPERGACLSKVVEGSNAERSGLREGDVLLAYGGDRLESFKDLAPAMGKVEGEEAIPVKLWRDGKEIDLKVSPGMLGVKLDERPPREAAKAEREFAMLLRGLRGASVAYEPLPGTRQEVEAITGKFKGSAEKLLGADASELKFKELLESGKLGEYRYLHFATHGVPNRERAFDSALILSHVPEDSSPPREATDGRLTAGEILRSWSLRADLVVLSACQTAVGQHAGGEGYLGFAQALLLSGAKSVVLSLWKVDDTATALLMERFYENLLGSRPGTGKGIGKAEALREAQSWLRALTREEAQGLVARQNALVARVERDGDRGTVRPLKPSAPPADRPAVVAGDHPYADPYFWAAFILIGDPD